MTGLAYTTTNALFPVTFPVTPRVAPTGITVTNTTQFQVRTASAALVTLTNLQFSTGQPNGAGISSTIATGSLVAGNATNLYNISGGQVLFTGCEL